MYLKVGYKDERREPSAVAFVDMSPGTTWGGIGGDELCYVCVHLGLWRTSDKLDYIPMVLDDGKVIKKK